MLSDQPNPTTQSAYAGCAAEATFSTTANTKNQIALLTYDAAGNVTTSCGMYMAAPATCTYDAENHLTQFSWSGGSNTYTYDGDGKRVMKSGSPGTIYWYGAGSDVLIESDTSNNNQAVYEYFAGQRAARILPSNEVGFYFTDHLGNTRFFQSLAGFNISDFYPFGGERVYSTGTTTHYKFTGKERDSESGLDNFGARYDGSSLGRYMSPDPLMASATVRDPQTWNRYSYALNNPLKYVDPTGMIEENAADCAKDKQCVTVKVNVIYDQKANLTDKQKEAFNKQLLQEAKDEYGDAHIHLDVKYSAGGYDDKGNIQGVSKDSINVIVSDFTPSGTTATSQVTPDGYALTQVNINTAAKSDLAHEFAHDFLGDTTGLINRIASNDPSGIIGAVSNAAFDIINDGMREAMKNPSPVVRSSIVAPQVFNSGAKQFQQVLTQQAAIRPRQ